MVNSDWVLLLTKLQELLLQTSGMVYDWIEDFYDLVHEDEGAVKLRDNLNMSAFIIDNTIVDAVTTVLAAITTLRPSGIQLKSSGAVVMEGEGIKEISLKIDSMNTPTPALEYGLTIAKIGAAGIKAINLVKNNVTQGIRMADADNKREERKNNPPGEEL
jgi:hypothetical protein